MVRLATAAALVALALGQPPVRADVPGNVPFVDVHFADLDLTRVEGASALYHRLQLAAQAVCASPDNRERAQRSRYQDCVRRAISEAVVRVDRPSAPPN